MMSNNYSENKNQRLGFLYTRYLICVHYTVLHHNMNAASSKLKLYKTKVATILLCSKITLYSLRNLRTVLGSRLTKGLSIYDIGSGFNTACLLLHFPLSNFQSPRREV